MAKKKKIKKGVIKKGVKGILKGIKNTAKKSPFLVLVPYKKLMQKKLKKKGITPKNDIKELAIQFYNEFVKRRNYDEYGMEILYTDVNVNNAEDKNYIPPEVVSQMIPAIINLLKNIISSIKSGKETDPELKEAAESAEKEIKNMEEKINEKSSGGEKKFLIPLIAGVAVLAVFLFFFKRK